MLQKERGEERERARARMIAQASKRGGWGARGRERVGGGFNRKRQGTTKTASQHKHTTRGHGCHVIQIRGAVQVAPKDVSPLYQTVGSQVIHMKHIKLPPQLLVPMRVGVRMEP